MPVKRQVRNGWNWPSSIHTRHITSGTVCVFISVRTRDAYMRQSSVISLLLLYGAKTLSESILPHCQLDLKEHTSVKLCLRFKNFFSRKWTWNVVCETATILSRPQCGIGTYCVISAAHMLFDKYVIKHRVGHLQTVPRQFSHTKW